MTAGQFFSILRARWIIAVSVFVLIVASTVGASLVWPKKYSASASVVIDAKPDPVTALLYPGMGSPAFMATQVDILNSERVAQRVVANLKLADNPQVKAQWQEATKGQGDVQTWLAESLLRSMDVKPARESNVLTITYKAADPRFAAGMANAFLQAYMDTVLDMRVNPARQYSTFFDGRVKEAREAVETAQTKLSGFQKDNGIVATDERLDIESARLNELSSQLVTFQAVSAESTSRNTQALGASADKLQDVLTNPVIGALKSDLSRAETSLQTMNSRFGESHPQVIETKASIAELKLKIEQEMKRVTGGVGVTNSINKQREGQIRAELEAQRAKVLRMKAVRDQGMVLARDVDSAQRNFDVVQGRLSQSSLESHANQTNIYPLTKASVPLDPSSPRILLNTLLACFAGTLAAVLVALGFELMDRRVRDHTDIVAALGLPVLGVLPNGQRRASRLGQRRADRLQQRLIGQLPRPDAKRA